MAGRSGNAVIGADQRRRTSSRRQVRYWRRWIKLELLVILPSALGLSMPAAAQTADPPSSRLTGVGPERPVEPGQSAPHITITLADALQRAQKNDAHYSAALTDAKIAREDYVQARAAGLPSVSMVMSSLLTQGNGVLPTGRYVTNDGVHVYRQWAVVHQDLSFGALTGLGGRRAAALKSLAAAKSEIARRGLRVTVTKDYYALVVSQRKYATLQENVGQAERFLAVARNQQRQGDAAHSDVIKAQIQFNQQQAVLQDAQLQMDNDHLTLAVLLFPTFTENFSVVDDLDQGPSLPPFADAQAMAARENPDMQAAMATLRESSLGVSAARAALLPSVTADMDYGIEANAFALRSRVSAYSEKGPLPNLGYFATLTLNLPVWDWGALRSKIRQAEYHREQARVELSLAQRQAIGELYSSYNEAQTAESQVGTWRETANLASESLRLTNLRYEAGQASALEVVDAQSTLAQARDAYDDALARFRLALAQLQTLTGPF